MSNNRKLTSEEICMLIGLALDDDQMYEDAVARGANNSLLVSEEFMARIRVTYQRKWQEADVEAENLILNFKLAAYYDHKINRIQSNLDKKE